MIKVAAVSANLGNYDEAVEWVAQKLPPEVYLSTYRFNDRNFPPRSKAMTASLQAAIVKMFAWQLIPNFDVYIWVDASCALLSENSVAWFLGRLGDRDLALFQHPHRKTVREEYKFMQRRMAAGNQYLLQRYEGEWLDEQYKYITSDPEFTDTVLYASTAFAYCNNKRVQMMMKEWFFGKARFLLHDQLYLPYAIAKTGCTVSLIPEKYTQITELTFVRKRQR